MRLFTQHERCAPRVAPRPTPRAAWLAALALGLAAPVVLPAQDSASVTAPDTGQQAAPAPAGDSASGQTHTVKKGDTLWGLASFYLNDPFLWPSIYRLNTAVVEDPHWIYPGEVLRVPGGPRLASTEDMLPRMQPEQVKSTLGSTVFSLGVQQRREESSRLAETAANYSHTAVREGEFIAAPWLERAGAVKREGRIVGSAELPGIAQASNRQRIIAHERVYITLPAGTVASPGDRFVTLANGPRLADGAQVVVPTGIVEVERVGNDEASTVRVVQQFGDMLIGQEVAPLERFTMPADARPTPLENGTECTVVSVPAGVVLPSIGYYVILSATASDGVKLGDQFTLYSARRKAAVDGTSSVTLPEEPVALAQVVKVTDLGTTALVVSQRHPVIRTGVNARLTAKMP